MPTGLTKMTLVPISAITYLLFIDEDDGGSGDIVRIMDTPNPRI
jgi:hypothetical protein